ncbi:NUC189-domain-containing protein [Massarina eburnea CBS 473.64]|uniref:NUC189-domain-containing protein n=1 Tax=Massarina eburnea CBS 473.64 TaxID=1395130 RepID=A0A6A6RW85_9PLEO|nr:NUC189-domain-containing protein [Massarina eburnea CBS 473.64]
MAKSAKPAREPPAKKTKLSQPTPPRANRLKALANGAPVEKPALAAKMNGVRNSRKDRVQEATAVVSGGPGGHGGDVDMADAAKEVIEISSGEDEIDYSSDEGGNAEVPIVGAQPDQPIEHGSAEPEEMTFGERLHAQLPDDAVRVPHVVDVESAFVGPNAESRALATAAISQPLAAPSATSLGTVLTQALQTNDQEMLDSCLRVNDVETIYATIERLPSPLVGTLLQKLAERLHKKPGRPGMLMVWVQWSLSAHGGYLATQPQLVRQLATLNKVLKERASGLQPLLSLKGRLDMLHTQLELRRRNQRRAANDDMDEAVIYVEGEESSSAEEESDVEDIDVGQKKRSKLDHDEENSSIDGMPTTMEVDVDSEGSEDSEDMIDDEADETDADTGDDVSEEVDDLDDGEDEEGSESEEESKPARRSTAGRAGLSRRA